MKNAASTETAKQCGLCAKEGRAIVACAKIQLYIQRLHGRRVKDYRFNHIFKLAGEVFT